MKFKKVVVKAITRNTTTEVSGYTLYLFEKKKKRILPIQIDENSAHSLMLMQQGIPTPVPHIHKILLTISACLGGKVMSGCITCKSNGIYNSSLRIKKLRRKMDIEMKLTDVIAVILGTERPIYINEDILKEEGIDLTSGLFKYV